MRMGQSAQATADLQKGAALETADFDQFYPVGKSLERVQGSARQSLERYRSVARAEAHGRQQRRDAVRYEQRRRAEAEVLRDPRLAAPPAPSGIAAEAADKAADANEDLFADEADKKPAAKAPAEADEPAADVPADDAPAKQGDAADSDNPFGDEPKEEMKEEK
jgi:hypothetical protein